MEYQLIAKQIESALEVIAMLEELLVSGIAIKKEELMSILGNGVLRVFPIIVDSYEMERLQEYKTQIQYWENQWNRIQEAIEREDRFYLIDVLAIETKGSFMEYLELLNGVDKI